MEMLSRLKCLRHYNNFHVKLISRRSNPHRLYAISRFHITVTYILKNNERAFTI